MLRNYISVFLFLVIATGIAPTQKAETITIKNSVDMRNGPGSYYKLILRLNPGAEVSELDEEQQWLKVNANGKVGWIPVRSTYFGKDQQPSSPIQNKVETNAEDSFRELSGFEIDTAASDPYASPAQVAAAVKGFAKDFTARQAGSRETDLLKNFDQFGNPADYRQFRNQRLRNWSWEKAQARYPLEDDKAPILNPIREQIGWGIANVIAQQGLVNNRPLQQYLTHVALVVAENSHRYETPVQVYILDTDEITGYAAPNGAIFVSKGSLKLMQNEAEFAFFVAHELVHIVLNHGVKETNKRQLKILAERRFQELDREVEEREEKYEKTEEELTEWASQVYEYTVRDRLKQYEYEADYWGVIYTYRTGYDPAEGLKLLQRIYNRQGDFEHEIGKAIWKGTSLRNRIIKIKNQIQELDIPRGFGQAYQSTFQRKLRNLE